MHSTCGYCHAMVVFVRLTSRVVVVFDPYPRVLLQRLVAIPSCGHLPHEECPDAVLSAMIPFVSRHLDHNVGHNPE